MRSRNTRRGMAAAAALVSAGLVLAGCAAATATAAARPAAPGPGGQVRVCRARAARRLRRPDRQVGLGLHLDRRPRGPAQKDSYKLFTTCTGAKVEVRGLQGVRGPARRPRQGRQRRRTSPTSRSRVCSRPLVGHRQGRRGAEAGRPTTSTSGSATDWKAYGTVDGKFYAAPLGANVKSFVWYSPKMFEENGWTVPKTWDDMIDAVRQDRRHRHQAVVRRHRVR